MAGVTPALVAWRAVVAALSIAAAVPASAQIVQIPEAQALAAVEVQPAPATQPTVSLSDAVNLALRHSPAVKQSAVSLRSATGRLQQARGMFDPTLRFVPTATFDLKEMAPFLKAREISKRETIRVIASEVPPSHWAVGERTRDEIDAEKQRAAAA